MPIAQDTTQQIQTVCRNFLNHIEKNNSLLGRLNQTLLKKKAIVEQILNAKDSLDIDIILQTNYQANQTTREFLTSAGTTWAELVSFWMDWAYSTIRPILGTTFMHWVLSFTILLMVCNIIADLMLPLTAWLLLVVAALSTGLTMFLWNNPVIFEMEGSAFIRELEPLLSLHTDIILDGPWQKFGLSFDNQEAWLDAILEDPTIAQQVSPTGDTMLHAVMQIRQVRLPTSQQCQQVTKVVMHLKDQCYVRNQQNETPLFDINSIDPYNRESIFGLSLPLNLDHQLDEVDDFLVTIQREPAQAKRFLLLEGPPGTGKSETVVNYLKNKGHVIHTWVDGEESDRYMGNLEHRVSQFFETVNHAAKNSAFHQFHLLFVEKIDIVCPLINSSGLRMGFFNRGEIAELFQKELDKLDLPNVALIGTTANSLNVAKSMLSCATRVLYSLPNEPNREQLLKHFFVKKRISDQQIQRVAHLSIGWSHRALRTIVTGIPDVNVTDERLEASFYESTRILENDFKKNYAHAEVTMPSFRKNNERTPFAALNFKVDVLSACFEELDDFLNYPGCYSPLAMHVLLQGPPGGGKTTAVRTFAKHANIPFIYVYSGITTEELRELFIAANAFGQCIVFIDEIDKIAHENSPARELLQEQMDGLIHNSTILIGATNYPERIAPPLIDRFKFNIHVPRLNEDQRGHLITSVLNDELKQEPKLLLDEALNHELAATCPQLAKVSDKLSIRVIKWELQGFFGQQRVKEMKNPQSTASVTLEQLCSHLEKKGTQQRLLAEALSEKLATESSGIKALLSSVF